MAHILIITNELAGLLNSACELGRRLQLAGHRVTYGAPAEAERVVTAQGLTYLRLEPNRAPALINKDRKMSRLTRLRSLHQRRRRAVQALGVAQFPNRLRALQPDLLLVDLELHEYIMPAVALGVPVALLSAWMSIWKHPGLPPLHTDIIPGRGWRGSRLGIELAWLRFRVQKRRRALRQWKRCAGLDWVSVMREHARETGFPFRKEVERHHWQIPFSYRSLPVLCLRARELEFPHESRSNVRYIGPMIHEQRADPRARDGVGAELERLFLRCRESQGTKRLIYCGFSSFVATNRRLLPRLIEAFQERPHWDLVLGLGLQLDVAELGPMPANIHAFSWVPQLRVLKHTDVAIIHGGPNTIDECLHFGVPMLVYCCGINDTPGNTARVIYRGLGIAGDPKADDPGSILRRLEEVLNDRNIAASVARTQKEIQRYEHERRAERAVEQLLGRP